MVDPALLQFLESTVNESIKRTIALAGGKPGGRGPLTEWREFGAWIRHTRKARGVTLAEAAALCGVGVRFLLELEHGKPTASLGKALTVLKRMGLDVTIHPRGSR